MTVAGPHSEDEAARRLAAIVESSEDAIIAKDLDGTILSWNGGAERIYGYTAAEAVGHSIELIVRAAVRRRARADSRTHQGGRARPQS